MVLGPVLGLALALRLSRVPRFLLAGGTVLFFVVLTGGEPYVMLTRRTAWISPS